MSTEGPRPWCVRVFVRVSSLGCGSSPLASFLSAGARRLWPETDFKPPAREAPGAPGARPRSVRTAVGACSLSGRACSLAFFHTVHAVQDRRWTSRPPACGAGPSAPTARRGRRRGAAPAVCAAPAPRGPARRPPGADVCRRRSAVRAGRRVDPARQTSGISQNADSQNMPALTTSRGPGAWLGTRASLNRRARRPAARRSKSALEYSLDQPSPRRVAVGAALDFMPPASA